SMTIQPIRLIRSYLNPAGRRRWFTWNPSGRRSRILSPNAWNSIRLEQRSANG
ncbi:MAG: hypothetical protein F4153_10530, partial [Acidimicrobiia bacterium]|nr:hypothetical protein [Acidimicrobiia bacterium]